MKSTSFVKVIEKIQTIKKISFFVWDVSKDEHDEVLLYYFFWKIEIKNLYLNLVAISSSNHIKMHFEGVGKATLGIRIMVGMEMVLSCGIEQVSSRDQRCNLFRSGNSPAWP